MTKKSNKIKDDNSAREMILTKDMDLSLEDILSDEKNVYKVCELSDSIANREKEFYICSCGRVGRFKSYYDKDRFRCESCDRQGFTISRNSKYVNAHGCYNRVKICEELNKIKEDYKDHTGDYYNIEVQGEVMRITPVSSRIYLDPVYHESSVSSKSYYFNIKTGKHNIPLTHCNIMTAKAIELFFKDTYNKSMPSSIIKQCYDYSRIVDIIGMACINPRLCEVIQDLDLYSIRVFELKPFFDLNSKTKYGIVGTTKPIYRFIQTQNNQSALVKYCNLLRLKGKLNTKQIIDTLKKLVLLQESSIYNLSEETKLSLALSYPQRDIEYFVKCAEEMSYEKKSLIMCNLPKILTITHVEQEVNNDSSILSIKDVVNGNFDSYIVEGKEIVDKVNYNLSKYQFELSQTLETRKKDFSFEAIKDYSEFLNKLRQQGKYSCIGYKYRSRSSLMLAMCNENSIVGIVEYDGNILVEDMVEQPITKEGRKCMTLFKTELDESVARKLLGKLQIAIVDSMLVNTSK